MKSKITIDLDWDNQPVIRIDYQDSEDVRDKMVKRFMETFKGNSCWANFGYDQSVTDMLDRTNSRAILRPLEPDRLWQHVESFVATAEKCKKTND